MARTSSTLRITGSFFSRGARTKVRGDHCRLRGVFVEELDAAECNGAGAPRVVFDILDIEEVIPKFLLRDPGR
jgi:hypothetical protein